MRLANLSSGCLLLIASLTACGKDTSVTIEGLLPTENAVKGWVYDPDYQLQPVITTNSKLTVGYPDATTKVGGINGSATPFVEHRFSSFIQRYYSSGDYRVLIYLAQMPDAATSTSLYNDIAKDEAHNYNWQPAAIGEAGRVASTGAKTVLNAHKGLFYFEVTLKNKDASDIPSTTEQIVLDFGKAIASKIK